MKEINSVKDINLSIIIPIFNNEQSIKKCLESILSQETNIIYEIIIVDDGSTDNTVDIIKYFFSKNIIIISQCNLGAGSARNTGIKYARGRYLLFIDADDYLSRDCLEVIYNKIYNKDIDILIFMYEYYDEKYSKQLKMQYREYCIYNNDKFIGRKFKLAEYYNLYECKMYPWNKVYRKAFIDKYKIKFSESYVHNDIYFNIVSMFKANSIVIIPDVLYIHTINTKKEQITQIFDDRRLDAITVLDQCDKFLKKENSIDIFYYNVFKCMLIDWIISQSNKSIKHKFIEYKKNFLLSITELEIEKLNNYIARNYGYKNKFNIFLNKIFPKNTLIGDMLRRTKYYWS